MKLNITVINGTMIKSPIIAETTGLVMGGEVLDLKLSANVCLFHSLGDSVGSSPRRALNLLIFLLRLGWRSLGPRIIQA